MTENTNEAVEFEETIPDYYKRVRDITKKGISQIESNSDRAHNAVIMQIIFEFSNVVRMYCGELSLFRESFKKHIEEDKIKNPEKYQNYDPVEKLEERLVTFLNNKGRLEVILERVDDSFFKEPVYTEVLEKYMHNGQVEISYIPPKNMAYRNHFHFTIGIGDSYGDINRYMNRIEIGKESHTAIYNSNDPDSSKSLVFRFNQLKRISKPVFN